MVEDKDFIGQTFPQNCGDNLYIIKKSNQKIGKVYGYLCKFLKYPCEVLALKNNILNGKINNPQIDVVEFQSKIWPQNCGDSLKIIRKTEEYQYSAVLYECEFIKYPYKLLTTKNRVQRGVVDNPEIERVEFMSKIWPQKCGDFLKVIRKTEKQNKEKGNYLFECEFINYPYKVFATKGHIIDGAVENYEAPWKNGNYLKTFIRKNFKNKKPTLYELAKKIGLSLTHICNLIREYNLQNLISYYESKEETSLRNFVSQFVEVYPEEYYISDKEGKYYGIDVYIPSKKIGFEFNGTYWHSELFKDSQYHQKKSLVAAEKGIQLFHIWEHEWNDPVQRPIIEALIKSKLGKFSHKIGASKCQIVDLSYKKYADFCNENHIQGEAGAKVKLGLTYQGKLIQVMSFGVPRFADSIEWEIIRECSKSDYIVLGGKEKLWNHFIKHYKPQSVISYCDYSKFNGTSYLKLGFKKVRLNKPGFVWYDEKSRSVYWRNPYKHKEYKNKYIKVWDSGQLVFVWTSSK